MQEQSFVEIIRPYAELLYFISTIIIAVAALFALKQISVAKKSLTIQSKRDALKLTAAQCTHYFESIIPLVDRFDNIVEEKKDDFFQNWDVSIGVDKISVERTSEMKESELSDEVLDCLGELCNAIESFSIYFSSAVGDEYVAYNTVGATFIDTVTEIIPWLLICREEGHYKNTIELFLIWKNRNDADNLLKEKNAIDKKLSKIKKGYIKTLGVET